jgi:outer membrane receptor protein involved in Fe transport
VIDDAKPLSLKVGNNNLKLPRKHHFKLNLNQTFIESASAIEFKMEYQILNDFIAQRSRFFIQETYLPQYNYTVLQGATLYSVENSGTQQLLSGQLDYSTLSNFLKSSVKLAIGYTYEHTPAFAQEERNDWDRNQFTLNVGLISNFSRKIEISINSSTDLNRLKSKQSEASDMLNERVSLGIRTSIIPKFTLKATLSHSYYKQFTDNQQTNNTTLEASIARKLGKNIDFSLNGYNLLDSQKSETLLKTAEYTGFSRIATTGRCIMASLSYKF